MKDTSPVVAVVREWVEKAEEDFAAAVRLKPDLVEARVNLAFALFHFIPLFNCDFSARRPRSGLSMQRPQFPRAGRSLRHTF